MVKAGWLTWKSGCVTNVFSVWLALIDESQVNELKLCRGDATEINQSALASAISKDVFFYLKLVDSCKFYEQQLRMVDAASMRQVEQQLLCPYCRKKGHALKDCWKWARTLW